MVQSLFRNVGRDEEEEVLVWGRSSYLNTKILAFVYLGLAVSFTKLIRMLVLDLCKLSLAL